MLCSERERVYLRNAILTTLSFSVSLSENFTKESFKEQCHGISSYLCDVKITFN